MHQAEQTSQRLAAFLAHRLGVDHVEVMSFETVAGGYARSIAKVRVRYEHGDILLDESLVLRSDAAPGYSMLPTNRDHEWLMLTSVAALPEIAAPRARYYDDTGEHLGARTIVTDHVGGSSLQSVLARADDHGDHPERLARLLGTIHTITPDRLPAEVPGAASSESRIEELIAMWRSTEANGINNDPVIRYAAGWLEANAPPPLPVRLCHGDPQARHVAVKSDGSYVVTNWEFATIGDPREDLGWYNMFATVTGPNLYAADPERFLAAYRAVTGFSEAEVNDHTVNYFTILGTCRIASIVWDRIDNCTRGEHSGAATALEVGSLSIGHPNFLEMIDAMQATLSATAQPAVVSTVGGTR